MERPTNHVYMIAGVRGTGIIPIHEYIAGD